jgi:2-octaprenyl-6-methoxyphenol hydroxylase
MNKIEKIDILIVGGGLTGMALMLALAPLGYRVRLAEAREMQTEAPDILETRSIALSPASIQILKQLDVWPRLNKTASPIKAIHISEQGRFGQARLDVDDTSDIDQSLGAVAEMHVLNQALKACLNPNDIWVPARVIALDAAKGLTRIQTDSGEKTVQARWVIAADGAHSTVRKLCQATAKVKTYAEHAIAANITLSRAHHQIAYERFTPDGPLALLPLTGPHMALVWTQSPQHAEALTAMPEKKFLNALQHAFGYRTGRFLAVGSRQTYPLQQVMMPKQVCSNKIIFIGNAAHTLHPVAGQGLNLGLRDVAMLAECAAKYDLTDEALIYYQKLRKSDQAVITTATDALVSLFKSRFPGIGFARRMGLLALDNSAFLKNVILRHAKGLGGVVPDLVCGVPLSFNLNQNKNQNQKVS